MVNFWVILSFLLVGNCLASVQCSNGRLCSDGIECNEDGTRFCSTQACNQRSRRILQNELGKRSVEESFLCDRYLQMEHTLKCGDNGILVKNFEVCNQVYHNYCVLNDGQETLGCTEQCIRRQMILGAQECEDIRRKASSYYSFCAAECNFCFVPEAWPLFAQLYGQSDNKRQVYDDLGQRCSTVYGMSRSFMMSEFLIGKIDEFVQGNKLFSDIDLKDHFKVLNKSLQSLVKYGNGIGISQANLTAKQAINETSASCPTNDQTELNAKLAQKINELAQCQKSDKSFYSFMYGCCVGFIYFALSLACFNWGVLCFWPLSRPTKNKQVDEDSDWDEAFNLNDDLYLNKDSDRDKFFNLNKN